MEREVEGGVREQRIRVHVGLGDGQSPVRVPRVPVEEVVPALDCATEAASKHLHHRFSLHTAGDQLCYRSDIPDRRRRRCRRQWQLRRVTGKALSVLRLVKALFTFEGGLDYIAWKLERHSGEEIVIPDKVRRAPLIHLWSFFWGLYRRGIFK